jgi:ribonuclease HI
VHEPVEDHGDILSYARLISVPRPAITVYTDGACSGNPGPGGWAWAVAPGGTPFASGFEEHTTNQRMEIRAALEALRSLAPGPVHVVTDSTYVKNCFDQQWYVRWERNGWRNSKKEPVANRDLWEALLSAVRARPAVTWAWVKGHSGDPMNDRVDALAVAAVVARAGERSSELGPPVPEEAGSPPTLFD